jgi:predicted glycoside hydrolase/deacetylase ChbG (UPF0249 family)
VPPSSADAPAARRLILNADDFGLTPGINQAILELHSAGVLTSATLMAAAPAFRSAAHAAFVEPSLSVGCHIVLVDGSPVLHPSEIPTLVGPDGRFRPTLGAFLGDLVRGRIRENDMEREAAAQIRRIIAAGITPSHLDTHKHTHMFPRVLQAILRAARATQVHAIRNPFEPEWAIRVTRHAPWTRRMQVRLLRLRLRRHFLHAIRRVGFRTTDGALGVLATGTLEPSTLEALLAAMPAGTWELVCHPGYPDAELSATSTRLLASRETERVALLQVLPQFPEIGLVNFEQIAL